MAELFQHGNAPSFSEWKPDHELLEAAPAFESFAYKGLRKNTPKRYFWSSRIKEVEQQLREINKTAETKFSLWLGYGSSPDEPTCLVVTAQGSEKPVSYTHLTLPTIYSV